MSTRHALLAALLSSSAALASSSLAQAADEQMVVFDETYTQELNGNVSGETYHHGIAPKATEPDSWLAPVPYAKGTAYVYLEIIKKPSSRDTIVTVCFDGPRDGYGCIDSDTYKTPGTYTTVAQMKDGPVWQYNQIAWGKRRADYHLVIKDPALGGAQGGKPSSDYVPTTMRAVLTIVPPGATYTPPTKGTGMTGGADGGGAPPSADGGATTTPDASAPVAVDASPPTGSGGSGGSTTATGGSGGSTTASGGAGGAPPTATGGTSGPTATGGSSAGEPSRPKGGCSVGGASGGAGAFVILALASLMARRRRRS